MDYMRSCYKTKMRLRADSSEETDVEWYFADANAKVFPFQHSFGSLNWETAPEDRPHTIGEVWPRVREYSKSAAPVHRKGIRFCGPASAFLYGAVAADPVLDLDGDGVPLCCYDTTPACAVCGPAPPKYLVQFWTVTDEVWPHLPPHEIDHSAGCVWTGSFVHGGQTYSPTLLWVDAGGGLKGGSFGVATGDFPIRGASFLGTETSCSALYGDLVNSTNLPPGLHHVTLSPV